MVAIVRTRSTSPLDHNTTAPSDRTGLAIRLLGGFELSSDGRVIAVPTGSQHLVAYLAMRDRPTRRAQVAGALWLDKTDERACANLRSSLWRLRQVAPEIVDDRGETIAISNAVSVDYWDHLAWTGRILNGLALEEDLRPDPEQECLSGELLPDWYEDWVIMERERIRQRMLHALEQLVGLLASRGEYHRAIDIGLCAVRLEPIRESTHRALIAAHLAEGNRAEAYRQFHFFRELLADELELDPSTRITDLLADVPAPG